MSLRKPAKRLRDLAAAALLCWLALGAVLVIAIHLGQREGVWIGSSLPLAFIGCGLILIVTCGVAVAYLHRHRP